MSSPRASVTHSPPIAIIGMGCMFPKAADLTAYWRLLRRGEDGITSTPSTHWSPDDYVDPDPKRPDHTYCGRGGFLSPTAFDPTEFGIPPTILEATDTSQLLGLVVAKAALEDAGYGESREFNRERVSVILGVTGLQELALPLAARLGHPIWRRALAEAGVPKDQAEAALTRISDAYVSWQENSFPGLLGNVVAGRIANRLNLRGTNCVVDAACASSLSAAHLAMMELATGRCDLALTGGVDALNDIFMYMCFSKTPALSPTGDARPFSDDADGTVLGEGIGMLVLKRLDDAQRDGDRVYAVIRGIGTSSDGRSQSIYAPHAAGQARALRNAYKIAGLAPHEIELIEAHGTGTTVGDAVEFEALSAVYREAASDATDGADARWCAIGSVKSQIGHTKAAAGAAGLIKAALAIYHRALPPTIKINRPNPRMNIDASPFYINASLRPWVSRSGQPRRAGVSSFGFGGSNFHALLEATPAALAQPAWDGSAQIIALSGDHISALRAQLDEWTQHVRTGHSSPSWIAHLSARSRKTFSHEHAHRLTIVLETGDDLDAILREARAQLDSASPNNQSRGVSPRMTEQTPQSATTAKRKTTVWYGTGRPDGKLAFLFPGQGSQYVGMARDLACTFPEMTQALEAAEAAADEGEPRISALLYPFSAFNEDARTAASRELSCTENAQPALGAVCQGMADVLQRFGVSPDLLAGHSYGELVALSAAGRYDAATLYRLSRLRGRLMAAGDGGQGAMLAVKAPLKEVEAMIEHDRVGVIIANRNAPNQAVLSGPREEITRAAASCKSRGWAATALNVSGAFHSLLMSPAAGPFRQALESVVFAPGGTPVFANTTARVYPAGAAARSLLADQLTSPVDFVGVVNGLYDAGVRTFVEVGPKRVLTGLAGATLADRQHTALALDASAGRDHGGLTDLARVLAQLAAQGRRVDLTKWERDVPEPRKPRMVVPLVGANYRAPKAASNDTPGPSIPATVAIAAPKPIPAALPEPSSPPNPSTRSTIKATHRIESTMNEPTQPSQIVASDSAALIRDGLQAMQALQQQTAAAHQRFLEGQEQAHRAFVQLLEQHGRSPSNHSASAGSTTSRMQAAAIQTSVAQPQVSVSVPVSPSQLPKSMPTPITPARIAEPAFEGSDLTNSGPQTSPVHSTVVPYERIVLDVVCEKTGYPRDMIELDMDIEADLGIDSIKRVEIVAAIEERVPQFGGIKPEYMGGIRTLREILAFVHSGLTSTGHVEIDATTQPQPRSPLAIQSSISMSPSMPPPVADSTQSFADVLLEVVAQLTGYPRDMLELGMDLEADLGIDSIKRVEILAAVESRMPDLPPVKPEYMGSLRTLSQIVDYFASSAVAPLHKAAPSNVAQSQSPAQSNITALQRRVLVVQDTPLPTGTTWPMIRGSVLWVTHEGGELAAQLATRLTVEGFDARIVSVTDDVPPVPENLSGVIIVAPQQSPGELLWRTETEDFTKRAFSLIRLAAPVLQSASGTGGSMLACITRMDGQQGLTGGDFDTALGGLAGIIKTASQEWPAVRCRAIDVAPKYAVEAAVDSLIAELRDGNAIEVGLSPDCRITLTLEYQDAPPSRPSLYPGDVVVVSGGARGVTAAAAAALAHVVQPVFVLLGRSLAPTDEPPWMQALHDEAAIKQAIVDHAFSGRRASPRELREAYDRRMASREIRKSLERITAAGGRVRYECVNVVDESALKAVLHRVRTELGPIRGLIHAAGVLEDRRIEDKSDEQFARVYDTKVRGMASLLGALDLGELRQVILFSSVAGRFGNIGQSDYAAANEVLNKTARRLANRIPNAGVCAINWGPWDGGMVNDGLKRAFTQRGVSLIPLEAGAAAMVRECRLPPCDAEVIIGDGFEPASSVRSKDAAAESIMKPAFDRRIDIESHPFLRSHLIDGHPVLPAAVTMEWLGQAAVHANPGLSLCGLDDFRILRGVVLDTGVRTLQWLTGRPTRCGGEFRVPAEMRSVGRGHREIVHARATALLSTAWSASSTITSTAATRCTGEELTERPFSLPIDAAYGEVLFHGEHFRAIQEIRGISARGLAARVRTAPTAHEWMVQPIRGEWLTDPLAIDAAFQLAILWCHEELQSLSLPGGFESYRQYRPRFPRDGVLVEMRVRDVSRAKVAADFCFTDIDGAEVARIENYVCTVDAGLRAAFRKQSSIGMAV